MTSITNSSQPVSPSPTPQEPSNPKRSWCWPSFFNFFSRSVRQTDPQPGQATKETIVKTVSEKFPLTYSWWSGTKITISENSSASQEQLAFKGDQQEAQDLLSQLEKLQGKGTLILRKRKEGLEFHYKNFWLTPKQEDFSSYIKSVISAAYPDKLNADVSRELENYLSPTNKHDAAELQSILEKLKSAVVLNEPASLPERLTSTEVADFSNPPPIVEPQQSTIISVDPSISPIITPQQQEPSPVQPIQSWEKIPSNISLANYLSIHQSVSLEETIGCGSFGNVFAASIGSKKYVYKEEINFQPIDDPRLLTDNPELNGKFWRHADIAASRLNDLPHFAKSTAFILKITAPGKQPQQWYVPTEQTKNFGKTLPPGTKVQLCGQLIERAPGKELRDIIIEIFDNNKNNYTSFALTHFDTISDQLFEFLEKTFVRNLIHLDLKTENLIFDADPNSPTYQKLTVIDFGLGAVYGKRHKLFSKPKLFSISKLFFKSPVTTSGNPLQSKKYRGTQETMAPAVVSHKPYGSEVDFHSVGAILIELLAPDDAKKVSETFLTNQRGFKRNAKIPTSTQEYLKILGPKSSLATILKANPHMQKTIDLFFNVAKAPSESDRNIVFTELKNHMRNVVRPIISEKSQQPQPPVSNNPVFPIPEREPDSDDDSVDSDDDSDEE